MREQEQKSNWLNQYSSNILVCILLLVVVWQTIALFSIEKQFETFKENFSLKEQVSEKDGNLKLINTFKEDAYIRHQERDTTLILAVFGIITAVFAFFTHKGVKDEFLKQTKLLDDKISEYEKTLYENTISTNYSLGLFYHKASFDFNDIERRNTFLFRSIYYYVETYNSIIKANQTNYDKIKLDIKAQLIELDALNMSNNNFTVYIDEYSFKNMVKVITKYSIDNDLHQAFFEIVRKIKITE